METSTWQALQQWKDPELIHLADLLPDTVLKAWADSTTSKYTRAYDRWAEGKGRVGLPVDTSLFGLQLVGESTSSKAAVETAVNAISYVQLASRDGDGAN